jgi:hypothetical protein
LGIPGSDPWKVKVVVISKRKKVGGGLIVDSLKYDGYK